MFRFRAPREGVVNLNMHRLMLYMEPQLLAPSKWGDFTQSSNHCHFGSSLGGPDQDGNVLKFFSRPPSPECVGRPCRRGWASQGAGAVATCGCTSYAGAVSTGVLNPRRYLGRDLGVCPCCAVLYRLTAGVGTPSTSRTAGCGP